MLLAPGPHGEDVAQIPAQPVQLGDGDRVTGTREAGQLQEPARRQWTLLSGGLLGRTPCDGTNAYSGLMAQNLLTGWSRFEDVVAAARRSTWRTTARDAAVSSGENQGVTHLVRDVIDPGIGPAFMSDLSRRSGFGAPDSEAEQSSRLAIHAVTWLPAIVDEVREARKLLQEALEQLPNDTGSRIQDFLQRSSVEATFDEGVGLIETAASTPSW